MRRPIGLTVPYREVGYQEKQEPSRAALLAEVAVLTEMVRVLHDKVTELEAKQKEQSK